MVRARVVQKVAMVACQQALHLWWAKWAGRERTREWAAKPRGAEERKTFPTPRTRVAFRVLPSRDVSGLPQMESMLAGYGYRYPLDNS